MPMHSEANGPRRRRSLSGAEAAQPAWPDAEALPHDRLHRQLCCEVLAQMATGCAPPYPFSDAT